MSSLQPQHRSPLRSAAAWAGETVYLADLLVVALALFLVALGAFDPFDTPLTAVIAAATVVVTGVHAIYMRRHREEARVSAGRARERRGF